MISVYIDKKLEKYTDKINYTLDYIFNILGYSWKILKEDDCPEENDTLLYYTENTLEKDDLHKLAKHFSLIFVKADLDFYNSGTYFGDKLKNSIRRIEILKKIFPIICQKNIEHPILINKSQNFDYACIEFDIIGNVFFHLSEDELNKLKSEENTKKSKHVSDSAFDEFHTFPYLNRLLLVLDKTIQEFLRPDKILVKKCIWPKMSRSPLLYLIMLILCINGR